jgi:hypothetical protein
MAKKPRPGYQLFMHIGPESDDTTPGATGEDVCAQTTSARFASDVLDATCGPHTSHGYGSDEGTGSATVTVYYETTNFFWNGRFYDDSYVVIPPFKLTGTIGIDSVDFTGAARGLMTYTFNWRFNDGWVISPWTPPP